MKSFVESGLSAAARTEGGRYALRKASGADRVRDERLRTVMAGIEFPNPLVVGAGWDKKGRCVAGFEAIGFGGEEAGTVLLRPQEGNERPRLWTRRGAEGRVSHNRLGFNSPGQEAVAEYLDRNDACTIPVGINLGKNKDTPDVEAAAEYAAVAEYMYGHADYFVINVSSPNTPGLRGLQEKAALTEIVVSVKDALERQGGDKPVFVKIAPELDEEEINDVIDIVLDHELAGIIAANTTTDETIKADYGWAAEAGGLAGADRRYRERTTDIVRLVADAAEGRYDVIGVGGVNNGAAALEKIAAGAQVVQAVTAIREHWLLWTATRILRGVSEYMDAHGIESLDDIRGHGFTPTERRDAGHAARPGA